MKIINRLLLDAWLAENKEPLWTRGVVIVGYDEKSPSNRARALDYKVWSVAHADWVRRLEKYLGIYKGY